MNRDIVKLPLLVAAALLASGCATSKMDAPGGQATMISAAEFEAMITIEVREQAPVPVEETVAALR